VASQTAIPEFYKNIYNLINATDIPAGVFQNIKHISFNNSFNKNVDALNFLPNIESIVFGYKFNQRVDNLPETLTSLTFNNNFNRSVNKLPTARENINIVNFW
jgi:hypothetical protein